MGRNCVAGSPQQVDALVVGAQLQIVEALVQHDAVERAAVGGLDGGPRQRRLAALDGPQVPDQRGAVGHRHRLRRHGLGRTPVTQQRDQIGVLEQRQAVDDRRPGVAAVAVSAMTHRAACLDRRAGRRRPAVVRGRRRWRRAARARRPLSRMWPGAWAHYSTDCSGHRRRAPPAEVGRSNLPPAPATGHFAG